MMSSGVSHSYRWHPPLPRKTPPRGFPATWPAKQKRGPAVEPGPLRKVSLVLCNGLRRLPLLGCKGNRDLSPTAVGPIPLSPPPLGEGTGVGRGGGRGGATADGIRPGSPPAPR